MWKEAPVQTSRIPSVGSRDHGLIASGGQVLRTPTAKPVPWFGRCFYACGQTGLPRQIDCLGIQYGLRKVLKHDFLAATGLYESAVAPPGLPRRVVCKINRRMHFCFIPLGWLGRLVTHREVRNLRRCEGIRAVPRVLARPDPNSYVYGYIEGENLGARPVLPADFFEKLLAAVRQIHARNLIHFDLHKPGNILVGEDGRPYVIDFQLCLHIGERFLLSKRLSARLRRRLQAYDIYHVYKHKRRLQPELLTEAEERLSRNYGLLLRVHRAVVGPYKRIRRACLRRLYARGILVHDDSAWACPETDPTRWTKK